MELLFPLPLTLQEMEALPLALGFGHVNLAEPPQWIQEDLPNWKSVTHFLLLLLSGHLIIYAIVVWLLSVVWSSPSGEKLRHTSTQMLLASFHHQVARRPGRGLTRTPTCVLVPCHSTIYPPTGRLHRGFSSGGRQVA